MGMSGYLDGINVNKWEIVYDEVAARRGTVPGVWLKELSSEELYCPTENVSLSTHPGTRAPVEC